MLKGIKNVLGYDSELLIENSRLIKEQSELLKGLRLEMSGVGHELKSFQQEHVILQQVFDRNLDRVKDLKSEFEKEIADFKVLKSKLQDVAGERIIDSLNDKLTDHLDRLKTDVHSFNSLKGSLVSVGGSLDELRDEILRLKSMAGEVKKSDFQLASYINKVALEDKNKLELMKKIETLEKLISHERRSKH